MSISSVNPYMSMMSVYKTANENKQTSNLLDTVENTQSNATTRPGEDRVSLSDEALKRAEAERMAEEESYPRPYSPMTSQAIFDKAMANLDEKGNPIFEREKPIESILPENLKILEELKQIKPTTKSEMFDKEIDISMLMSYGDKEIFTSTEQVRERHNAYIGAAVFMNMERMAKEIPTITTMEGFAESLRSLGLKL